MLTHFSLFTGIGGIDLSAEWAGFKTVGQCEWADYPTKVLEKHWPNVPRWRDIRSVTRESADLRGIGTIDLISGGFPCQPFSVAGNQKGKEDNRYLWPEMLRVIREFTPRWVLGENVPGILSIAADDVCKDLEREGYEVGIFDYEAAAVGAKHRRERIFFVGRRIMENTCNSRCKQQGVLSKQQRGTGFIRSSESCSLRPASEMSKDVAYAERERQPGQREYVKSMHSAKTEKGQTVKFSNDCIRNQWAVEPELGRVANGIANRVDRLKCLGNAVVPQQVYPILKAIYDIETGGINHERL